MESNKNPPRNQCRAKGLVESRKNLQGIKAGAKGLTESKKSPNIALSRPIGPRESGKTLLEFRKTRRGNDFSA